MVKKIIIICLSFILITGTLANFSSSHLVYANQVWSSWVPIQYNGQVVDSMVFNGKTIEAVYSVAQPADNDATYACYAYIVRFYNSVYGINVYDMLSTSHTPKASLGSFIATTTPRVGDIIRFNNEVHWAVVKQVSSSGLVTVIQQNARWQGKGAKGATLNTNDKSVTYFTYSAYKASPVSANITNGTYSLVATKEGKEFSIDVPSGSKNKGVRLQIWTSDKNNVNQQFELTRQLDGTYEIASKISGKIIEVEANSKTDGASIIQSDKSGNSNQRFLIIDLGNSYYKLVSQSSNKCLDISGGVFKDGTGIQQYADNGTISQKFKLNQISIKSQTVNNGTYFIKNVQSNQVLNIYTDRIPKSDNEVTTFALNRSDIAQQFTIERIGNDYLIKSADSNVVLNVYNNNQANANDNVNVHAYVSGDLCQLWIIENVESNKYIIRSKVNPDLVLTPSGTFNKLPDVRLQQYNGSESQKWLLENK